MSTRRDKERNVAEGMFQEITSGKFSKSMQIFYPQGLKALENLRREYTRKFIPSLMVNEKLK